MSFEKIDQQSVYDDLSYCLINGKKWEERFGNANKLNLLLKHARTTVPFYQNYFSDYPKDDLTLLDFPLSHKTLFRNSDQMLSTAFEEETLTRHRTSGTSGIPLTIIKDGASSYGSFVNLRKTQTDRMPEVDFKQGEPGIILIDDQPNKKGGIAVIPSLNHAFFERISLGKNKANDQRLVKYLRSITLPLLCGRPRSLLYLMELDRQTNAIEKSNMRFSAIRSSGDNLYEDQRRSLETWFGCNVYNAYQSQEGGGIGMDCPYKTGFHLLNQKSVVEILQEDGSLKKEGEGIIVVTNLENWAQPFIRYQTKDRARIEWTDCNCGYQGYSIVDLKGRDSTYFIINGYRFNPSLLSAIFENLPIKQFQVIQLEDASISAKWVAEPSVKDADKVTQKIIAETSKIIGYDPKKINVQQVNKIGGLYDKIERYICLFNQTEVLLKE